MASTDLSIVASSTHVHFDYWFFVLLAIGVCPFVRPSIFWVKSLSPRDWLPSVRMSLVSLCPVCPLVSRVPTCVQCVHLCLVCNTFFSLPTLFVLLRFICTLSLEFGIIYWYTFTLAQVHRAIRYSYNSSVGHNQPPAAQYELEVCSRITHVHSCSDRTKG